jgi:ribosomal protein L7/L12
MEFLVPLLIVLVIVVVVAAVARYFGRKGRAVQEAAPAGAGSAKPVRRGREITREMAQEASAKLTPEVHRTVYSLIARQQVLNAVKEYRRATGSSLGESAAAVAALAEFPQPSPEPELPAPRESPLTVEDIINAAPVAAPTPNAYRYRAIVSRGDEVREVASTRLNEEIFGKIRALANSGDFDAAAHLLRDHADIGLEDAREFVSMIEPENFTP